MKAVITAITLFVFSTVASAKAGSPIKIRCELSTLTYKEDITKLMDLQELFRRGDYTFSKVATQDISCSTYEGEVTVCESVIKKDGIYVRYHFNTQNGALEVEDLGTGLISYTDWLNQEDVTKSGYLHGVVSLTSLRGGLMGSKRIFRVETGCWGIQWQK